MLDRIEQIRHFVTAGLCDVPKLLRSDVATARAQLAKHVTEIRTVPHRNGSQRYYVADGGWNLLGGYATLHPP
jgi:hypothetical protein